MPSATLEHPELGAIQGIEGDKVQQFFGIQYATLKDRLSPPELKTKYESSIVATKFGYVVTQSFVKP